MGGRAAAAGLVIFLLSLPVLQASNKWGVVYSNSSICAVQGSSVDIHCTFRYPSTVTEITHAFWFNEFTGDKVDLMTYSDFEGRVQYFCDANQCTLRISDLKENDTAKYYFRFITNFRRGRFTGRGGVKLSVTGLQVKVNSSRVGLECVQGCSPGDPTYIWYKNGQKITEETSATYAITTFNPEDSYACAVRGHEDLHSPLVCVTGETCNKVMYTDRSICAFKGSSVEFSCTYNSHENDVQSKFWFSRKNTSEWQNTTQPEDLKGDSMLEGRVEVLEPKAGSSTLRISDLRESDSAEYRFKFKSRSFEWRSSLPATSLTVTALQVQVMSFTPQQSNTKAELQCLSRCSPDGLPKYVWFKNGGKVSATTSSYNAMFVPGESISCALEGHEDFRSPSLYAPKVPDTSVSPSAGIVEGMLVNLSCSSDADIVARFNWYKKNDSQKAVSEGAELVFRSIQAADSGEYYCTAKTELGMKTSESVTIDVKYAPKLSSVTLSPSAEIVEGSSVNLTCRSDANPAANYTWFKGNKRLEGQADMHHFTSISAEDKGFYLCRSENMYGWINSSPQYIDVLYAPKLPLVSVLVMNTAVTLTCSSDANPAANYTWYQEDQNSSSASGKSFTITDLRPEHIWSYYCAAQNPIGRHKSNLHTIVVAGSSGLQPSDWWISVIIVTIAVILVVALILFILQWIRRKWTPNPQTEPTEGQDKSPQVEKKQPAEPEDNIQYASVSFIKKEADPSYYETHKRVDEASHVEYAEIKFKSASPGSGGEESGVDPAGLHSTVQRDIHGNQ